jgi:hypothetical protein
MTLPEAIEVWNTVREKEIGVAIKCAIEDIATIRHTLYEARRSLADPSLEEFAVTVPKDPGDEIFIVRKTVELE